MKPATPSGETEKTIWIARPSPAALLPALALFSGAGILLAPYLPVGLSWIIGMTRAWIVWTPERVALAQRGAALAIHLPSAIVLVRMALLWFTRYELTDQRLRICTGVLMRRHDEIALHRIRDYAVRRPLFGLIFGYGSIQVISRDPTHPVMDMEWVPAAYEKTQDIRRRALAWKERMGYREFDTGSLS